MKFLCIGDSFTRGFGVKDSENWISRISIDNIELINRGVNGDTTLGMLCRLHTEIAQYRPQYVLITGGLNDFISGSDLQMPQNSYMAMAHQAFSYNVIPIVGIEPAVDISQIRKGWATFSDFSEIQKKQQKFRQWLIEFCKTFGIFYIDFYEAFEQIKAEQPDTQFYLDGLHLTQDGHAHISDIAKHSLKKFFNF